MCVRAKVHGATSAKENHTQYCTCRVALQLGIGRFWSKKRLSTWPRPRPDISSLYVNSGWLPWKCHGAVTHGERVNGHAWEKIDLLCLSKLFIENALEVKRCMIEPTAYVRRELLRDAAKTPSNGIKPSLLICHSKVLLRFFFFFFCITSSCPVSKIGACPRCLMFSLVQPSVLPVGSECAKPHNSLRNEYS